MDSNSQVLADNLSPESLFGALFDPIVWADPYPLYAELRGREPVAELAADLWVASSHAGVQALLRDPSCSSDERRRTVVVESDEEEDTFPPMVQDLLVFKDPPDHTRLRKLIVRAFTSRQIQSIQPRAIEIVDGLLDDALALGEFDVIEDLGHPLAVQIICELLGVPFADRHMFSEWGAALARVLDPGVLRTPEQDAVAGAAAESFGAYFEDLIADRRNDSADDLLSELIAAEEDGDRLSMEELVSVCLLLLVAGYETTVNLVGNGFVALMNNRDQYRLIGDRPAVLPSAINELLRFDSPVQMTIRISLERLELDGHSVPPGVSIVSFIGAANRDPNVFADPDVVDVTREHNPHLAFGGGIHHCLGAALARVEAQAAFAGLTRRMPAVELIDAVRRPTFTLRGFSNVRAKSA
jgi:cytochrome P450